MTIIRPTAPVAIFSENANYSAGPDIGTPTKVDPGAVADGHIGGPAYAPSCQHENHRQNAHSVAANSSIQPPAILLDYSSQTVSNTATGITAVIASTGAGDFSADLALGLVTVANPGIYRFDIALHASGADIGNNFGSLRATANGVSQAQIDAPYQQAGSYRFSGAMFFHVNAPGSTVALSSLTIFGYTTPPDPGASRGLISLVTPTFALA